MDDNVDDDAVQLVNVLLEIRKLLLLTLVRPETVLEPPALYEYAPTATEIPPPYTLAPKE
jgi:hypothetical protein